jgi:uncharacterized protein YegP (UPF0339 family)
MRFSAGSTKDGQYSWWLYGSSDTVAWAGETFPSQSNADRACEAFKEGAAEARFEVYEDKANEWRWRAWRSSDKVAASGEHFYDKSNAQRAADNVRDNAGDADGPK